MKSSNVETNTSLHNIDNFKKIIDANNEDILKKYTEIIIEYFKFIFENIKILNDRYFKFIMIRGLDTITNVFVNLLFYTKNLDLTAFHCQKALYFYIEFIGQISEEQNIFLQLNSRDATTYVYKKTLYELNQEIKKTIPALTQDTKTKMDCFMEYSKIYKIILSKMIYNDVFVKKKMNNNNDTSNDNNNNNDNNNTDKFEKITNKLIDIKLQSNELANLVKSIDIFDAKIEDIKKYYEVILCLLKKIEKNVCLINKTKEKIYSDLFCVYLYENSEKFINWLVS